MITLIEFARAILAKLVAYFYASIAAAFAPALSTLRAVAAIVA